MNYLAHLYLSFDNEEVLVGNYIADAVKGQQMQQFSAGIQRGIKLHRHIDTYTDNHPVVEHSKSRIRDRYRKYAGVIVDMYYDHFLAANWNDYADQDLLLFTRNAYRKLFKYYMVMPARMKKILPMMAAGNWLASYAKAENIGLALQGMSRRTKFDSGIENGLDELQIHYAELEGDFRQFFPELVSDSFDFLKNTTA